MTADLEAAFSEQITLELASSLSYLQLSVVLEARDLPGMASWMRVQAGEERNHAQKLIDHLLDRGHTPQIGSIEAPQNPGEDVLAIFRVALENEQRVSEAIRSLHRVAVDAEDVDSLPILLWFLEEQIEEEATVSAILGRLRLAGDDAAALLILDSELGSRAP